MFSDQDVAYTFSLPCRTLSAVAPTTTRTTASASGDGGDDAGNGWDDDDDYLDKSSSFTCHRFLVGSSIPSVSKLSDGNDDNGAENNNPNNNSTIEEEDEERINRLYLLQYQEDSHELTQKSAWVHPTGEVWSVGCHPTRGDWVVTCGGGAAFSTKTLGGEDSETMKCNIPLTKFQTTLWRIPDSNDNGVDSDFDYSENLDDSRQRSESITSAMNSSSKLEPLIIIPHGVKQSASQTSSGWEQRVGQILWNPQISPSNSSGDALYDMADVSSTEGGGNLLTIGWDASSPISLWDVSSLSDVKEVWSTHENGVESSRLKCRHRSGKLASMISALPRRVSWDPHDTDSILSTSGVDVVAFDMRCAASSSGLGVIHSAHRYGVADICHNHSQSNVVVTSGLDGVMKFWDLRMHLSNSPDGQSSQPPLLKAVRGGHSHWVTRAVYNPFHDQLVLSGGSDGIANLWRISSCSSAPLLELNDDDDDEEEDGESSRDLDGDVADEKDDVATHDGEADIRQPASEDDDGEVANDKKAKSNSPTNNNAIAHDIRVTRFECSDVTADLAWSTTDPWVYATLSHDGAVVVHHVPSKEKYKILL